MIFTDIILDSLVKEFFPCKMLLNFIYVMFRAFIKDSGNGKSILINLD